jgi:hypothetical protein
MIFPPDLKVTSEILWRGAFFFLLVDAGLVFLLSWRIKPAASRAIKWSLVVTSAVFWCLMWLSMSYFFWEPVYHYVFPEWARWFISPLYGLLFGAAGLLFWWVALRTPGNALVNFFLLGGLWGMLTHIWAIGRGILDKPPMLQGASPIAAVIMLILQFMFYWCIIVGIASEVQRGQRWLKEWKHGRLKIS